MGCPEPEENRLIFESKLLEVEFTTGEISDGHIRIVGLGHSLRPRWC